VIGDMLDSKRRPISVRDYHLMFEAGMFAPDERVELVRGDLIRVPPMGRPHQSAINRLNRLLTERFNGRAVVQVQCPVVVSDDSEPEPEFALLRWDPTGYEAATPTPADTYLLIEVSASSRAFDRRVKVPLYAETGVPDVWIVDVVDSLLRVYRDLKDGRYATTAVLRRGDVVACAAFPDDPIPVSEILPSPPPRPHPTP
jgi:Uma2 family endonuclease